MAGQTVSVRLPKGMYDAVSEVADRLSVDKSDAAGILLGFGISTVSPVMFTEATKVHLAADTLESIAALLRVSTTMPKAEQLKWKEFFDKMNQMRNQIAHG